MKIPSKLLGYLQGRTFFMIKCGVSVVLLSVLFMKTQDEMHEFWNGIGTLKIPIYVFAFAMTMVSILCRSYKWQLLLRIQGIELSLWKVQMIYYIALFFNNFFLGSVGGDMYRVVAIRSDRGSASGSISSILTERITGIVSLALVAVVASIVSIGRNRFEEGNSVHAIILLCFAVFLVIFIPLAIILRVKIENVGLGRTAKWKRLANLWERLGDGLRRNMDHKKIMTVVVLLSVAYCASSIIAMHLFSLSAGVNVNLCEWAYIVPVVSFLGMLPISINGVGVQEGTIFFFLDRMGIESSSALLVSLLPRAGMIICSLAGGFLYVFGSREEKIKG